MNITNKPIITRAEWVGDFSEVIQARTDKGQNLPFEVDREVYDEFLGSVPPAYLGKPTALVKALMVLHQLIPATEMFLVGEASKHTNGEPVYMAFVKTQTKFYYIGFLRRAIKKIKL